MTGCADQEPKPKRHLFSSAPAALLELHKLHVAGSVQRRQSQDRAYLENEREERQHAECIAKLIATAGDTSRSSSMLPVSTIGEEREEESGEERREQ